VINKADKLIYEDCMCH